MKRSILGIKLRDKKSNKEVRRRTKAVDVGYKIEEQKFKYAGHLIKGGYERWTKKATEWVPYDRKRTRSRLRTRWEDELR